MLPGGQGEPTLLPVPTWLAEVMHTALIVVAKVEPWNCSMLKQGHHNNQLPLPFPPLNFQGCPSGHCYS